MTPLISIRQLCKSFAGVQALDGVEFELLAGEVHALVGENGAGKSTLMKILSGIYVRDSGVIELDGCAINIAVPKDARELGIGIVHQELNLMNHLTAAQNIFMGREPRRAAGLFVDQAKMNAEANELFKRINLKLDPRTVVSDLTVAKQQMIEIAKALSYRSKVLIMDEPTAALNNEEVADLFAVILQLKEKGVGIVYISHKMDELKQIGDRVTVMRDGRYINTMEMAKVSVQEIIQMMVGRSLDESAAVHAPPSLTEVVLEVKGLTRGRALKNVSFRLHKGEILGFAGLMGAGRTEVARAIFAADTLDAGEIFIHGKLAHIRTPQQAVAQGIGYLSEDRKQFGLATGLDVQANVTLASMRRYLKAGLFLNKGAIEKTAASYVHQLSIKTPSTRQLARFLSGGNQQKIVIAKWLLRDCDILFFDEPTRGIDVGAKSEIYKLLQALAAEGKAIVVISSELPEVLRLSHRVLVMCEGRVTGIVPINEATQEFIMQLATQRESRRDKQGENESVTMSVN